MITFLFGMLFVGSKDTQWYSKGMLRCILLDVMLCGSIGVAATILLQGLL